MTLNRTLPPVILDSAKIPLLVPEVLQLSPGTSLHIAHNTIQPIIRVEFVFKAGKWFQPKPALASITAKMLLEGTIKKTAKQIAEIADFFGASLDVSHGFDRTTVTLYCLSKFLKDLLPLVFEVIQEPSFPEHELTLLKQRLIQALSVDKQKNGYLASEAYSLKLYGPLHPYTTFISEEEINAVTVEEVKSFHRSQYILNQAQIFVTGDLAIKDKENLIQELESNAGTDIQPSIYHYRKETIFEPEVGITKIHTKNKLQAAIRIGTEVIPPSHIDFPALYYTTHLLGGYFGSRLMKNIREDKGYTYGIYASLSTKENSTTFTIGTEVKGDKTRETLSQIELEVDQLERTAITLEEMHTVTKHLNGKFISDEATLFDQMDRYKSTVFLNLPADHYHSLVQAFTNMTPEKVKEVAAKYLSQKSLVTVVAGGAQAIVKE